jgi:hypothetical protein
MGAGMGQPLPEIVGQTLHARALTVRIFART